MSHGQYMTLNFGGEWDTMGANAWWIHIIA